MAAKKANAILRCIDRGIGSKSHEALVPFYSTLIQPHTEYYVQFWTLCFKEDANKLGQIQRMATKMIRGLQVQSYEERLKELGMFSLMKRRLRGDVIAVSQDLKGCHREEVIE